MAKLVGHPLAPVEPSKAGVAPTIEQLRFIRKHDSTFRYLWNYSFQIIDSIEGFPRPRWIALQEAGRDYWCDCRLRASPAAYVLHYTLLGRGVIRDSAGEHIVGPGRGMHFELDDPEIAYYYPKGDKAPWRFLGLIFDGLGSREIVRSLTRQFGPVLALDADHPALARLLGMENPAAGTLDLTACDGARMIFDLLAALADEAQRERRGQSAPQVLRAALHLTRAQMHRNLDVAELAEHTGVSREHLTRLFRRHLGLPAHRFILQQKMLEATQLLSRSELSNKQIAVRLGFSSRTSFLRAFKREMGIAPDAIRRGQSPPDPRQ